MNLIVDLGNTFQKIALIENDIIIDILQFEHINESDLEIIDKKYKPQKAILSSVIENDNAVKHWLKNHYQYFEVNSSSKLPFINDYETKQTLGTDRIAAVTGARKYISQGNLLVIQAGSCITFDFIDSNNHYQGGSISPGIKMKLEALHNFTGKLPLIKYKEIDYLCGKNTEESILAGVIQGTTAEINGMINNYEEKYSQISIIITGGAIKYFEKSLKNINFAVPNLVIIGLNILLELND